MPATLLEYAVMQACERYRHNGNEFTTANFQSALSKLSDSKPMVTQQVAELLLLSVPGVWRDQSRCHWIYEALYNEPATDGPNK